MKNSELYDAMTGIDEKYVDGANALLESSGDARGKRYKNPGKRPGFGVYAALAASVTVAIVALTVLGIYMAVKSRPDKGGEKLMPEFRNEISVPEYVLNNSSFLIDCSFEMNAGNPLPGLSGLTDRKEGDTSEDSRLYGIYVNNSVYSADPNYGLEDSDVISFYYSGGKYTEYVDVGALAEYYASNSPEVVGRDSDGVKTVPVNLSVHSRANDLKPGTKGRIFAGVFEKGEEGNVSVYKGSSVYYYCSGEVIGFGKTEEEAFRNASQSGDSEASVLKTLKADLNGDGREETVEILSVKDSYRLAVKSGENTVWQRSLSAREGELNSFSLYEFEGKKYILEYAPYIHLGKAVCRYILYGFSDLGSMFVEDEAEVQFDLKGKELLPVTAMVAFSERINVYLGSGEILISTLGGSPVLEGTPDPVNYTFADGYGLSDDEDTLRQKLNNYNASYFYNNNGQPE